MSANTGDLQSRICVSHPYFALRDIDASRPARPPAPCPSKSRPGNQAPKTLAEAARHTAILGLCAAASTAPDERRRYSFARTGSIIRSSTVPASDGRALAGHATGQVRPSRETTARSEILTPEGSPLFQLQLDYSVLTEKAFEKFLAYAHRPRTEPGVRGRAATVTLSSPRSFQ